MSATAADWAMQGVESNMSQTLGTGVSIVAMGTALYGVSESFNGPARWMVRCNGMTMVCTGIAWVATSTYEYCVLLPTALDGAHALRYSSRVYPVLAITYSAMAGVLMTFVCWRKVLQVPHMLQHISAAKAPRVPQVVDAI